MSDKFRPTDMHERVALDLALRIASDEQPREQTGRDYWFELYASCREVVYGQSPKPRRPQQ